MKQKSGFSRTWLAVSACLLAVAAAGGEIRGTVSVEGRMPEMRPINMKVDPICAAKQGADPALNESIVVDARGRLANVLLRVAEGVPEGGYPVPGEPVVLSQEGCMYRPRVFGLRVGQPLEILNPDGTIHNVHGMPVINRGFNLAMDSATTVTTAVFTEPEPIFPIKCDVHAWMRAYCAVFDHPFFAVSAEDGAYAIADLPPGECVIEAWHERLGVRRETVTVPEDGPATLDFTFSR